MGARASLGSGIMMVTRLGCSPSWVGRMEEPDSRLFFFLQFRCEAKVISKKKTTPKPKNKQKSPQSIELKFPISVSGKWEIGVSCLLSQTFRAGNCPTLMQQATSFFRPHRNFNCWVMLVLNGRPPGAWAKGSEQQLASWGQDCCVLSLL